MSPKEIGRTAARTFRKSLPANCAERDQETQEDYGIDFELEMIAEGEQATGFLFKAQVKGIETAELNATGQFLSFSLPVQKMRYYLRQLNLPVVLIVVDLATSTIYWLRLQGNAEVETAFAQALAATPVQQTMTLRIPVTQTLPDTFAALHQAAVDSQNALTLANLRFTNARALIESDSNNFQENADNIALQNDHFRSERLERAIRAGNPVEVYREYQNIFESRAESFWMRVSAAMNLNRLHPATIPMEAEFRLERINQERLDVCRALYLAAPETSHKNLRIFSLAILRSAQMRMMVEQELAMRINTSMTELAGGVESLSSRQGRALTAMRVGLAFRKAQCAFIRLFNLNGYGLLPYVWRQIASDITPFILRFGIGAGEASPIREQMLEWLEATYETSMLIAQHGKDWASVGILAVTRAQYASAVGANFHQQCLAQARTAIDGIEDVAARAHWTSRLQMLNDMLTGRRPLD